MGIELRSCAPLLEVYDMPTAIAFYRDLLGFTVVSTSGPDWFGDDVGWAWMRLNDVDVMLNTAYDDGARPPVRDPKGKYGFGVCLYCGCPDVDAAYEHLRTHGVEAQPPEDAPYGMRQLYFRDPDGYQLCFQWPVK